MGTCCTNCEAPDAEPYELVRRGGRRTEVHLCDPCYEALNDQLEIQ